MREFLRVGDTLLTVSGKLNNGIRFEGKDTIRVIYPPCSHPIDGDINGDCKVDFKDFAIIISHAGGEASLKECAALISNWLENSGYRDN